VRLCSTKNWPPVQQDASSESLGTREHHALVQLCVTRRDRSWPLGGETLWDTAESAANGPTHSSSATATRSRVQQPSPSWAFPRGAADADSAPLARFWSRVRPRNAIASRHARTPKDSAPSGAAQRPRPTARWIARHHDPAIHQPKVEPRTGFTVGRSLDRARDPALSPVLPTIPLPTNARAPGRDRDQVLRTIAVTDELHPDGQAAARDW
jgi:hypothetical protein